ncbi:NAD(P)H-hydrate dehydratase [Myroides odoratimimus]|uniref:NAD(P)H-hydrate dehydratase n=1 Tax=Myroides odoratimimus TaxID=76832 RepID=UPI001CE0B8D6|nr:NAD(P)H-hydrate dehydratase [Myroides odoratimimus]MCA4805468.1 NAD(P)H-hydrate dehydratase [Myroides odoratimimus]
MKIFNAAQIQALDKETVSNQYISSFKLMERATTKVFEKLQTRYKLYQTSFVIFCGTGNNGGDGLTLARLLKEGGAMVKVFLVQTKKYSPDNAQNQDLLEDRDINVEKFNTKSKLKVKKDDVIVDALFGIGLHSPLDEEWRPIFDFLNETPCLERVSIDMPSGLLADVTTSKEAIVFKADVVYTFQLPKTALLLSDAKEYVKELEILDIGLDLDYIESTKSDAYFVEQEKVRNLVKSGTKFSSKDDFGRVILIGGSKGKIGAMTLASKAAMNTGSGIVTTYVPNCGYTILQTAIPEVMCDTCAGEDYIKVFPSVEHYDAVGVGCGLGLHKDTATALVTFLKDNKDKKLVIDADALNIISEQKCLDKVPVESILTPHEKELKRLIGEWDNDFDKIDKVKQLAKKHNVIFVLKGAHTITIAPDETIYFNSSGNWGMATAGVGDTLTGMITSLLGQGYTSKEAAIVGVYLHGLAGDIAIENIHPHSLVASDLGKNISSAYNQIAL